MSEQKYEEKRGPQPISLTAESIRVSATTLVSIIGTLFALYFFFDDHWITKKQFELHEKEDAEQIVELKDMGAKRHAETKAELMRFAYYQRMATLKDMIRHLKAKKVVPNTGFSPVDQMTLDELESEYARVNQLYNTEQLKPK